MKIINKINIILSEWNPLGVDENIVIDEYRAYIPNIIKNIRDKRKLKEYLIHILIEDIGLEYDLNNENHTKDLELICNKLMNIVHEIK